MSTAALGRWVALDLETTGLNAHEDVVIDVGFLQFNGLKLERRYSSLVHPGKIVVSRFIQKLTGISLAALKKAPAWSTVQDDLADLAEHTIVAYNAGFEQSFLASTLGSAVQYADGLNLLPLCFPGAANFRLETFLAYWQLKPAEAHRGLADAEDMLKVMLTAVYNLRHHYPEQDLFLREKFATYQLAQTWIGKFFHLDDLALVDLAGEIDFTIPELPQAAALLAPSSAGAAIGLEEDSSTPPGAPADDASLGKRRTSSEDLSFSGAFIEKLLRDADLMGRTYPQHQFRQGQVDMARRVGQALKNNVHAMIQAPTGTGKTLAYLLPAMLLATVEGEKVLIATGTKTLQRQILGQEIPRVRQLLGLREEECPVAFMIGSQNHLCPQKLATAQNGRLWPQESEEVRWAFLYLASIIFFNEQLLRHQDVTHQCRLLSRAAISSAWKSKYPVLAQLETELAVDFRYCAGPRCPHAKCCAYQGGIKLARQAALIIGNHALLLAWPRGLERPRKIIIDEAQGMEKDATEAFHWELGQKSLASLVDRLRDKTLLGELYYLIAQSGLFEDAQATAEIEKLAEVSQELAILMGEGLQALAELIPQWAMQQTRFTELFWNEMPFPPASHAAIFTQIMQATQTLAAAYQRLGEILSPWLTQLNPEHLAEGQKTPVYIEHFLNLTALAEQATLHQQNLSAALQHRPDYTWSMRYKTQEGFLFYGAPIDIGQAMHDQVLAVSDSVVFTSATLGPMNMQEVAPGVEWPLGYAYLAPEKRFKNILTLPPVYDYQNKCRLLVADDVLPMHDKLFVGQILAQLLPLLELNQGRALLLFSAKQRFDQAREYLLEHLSLPLFVQNMGLRPIEDFKAAGQGVLLGMEALGEGIDIPGDTLSLVFIDKIPDQRQDLVIKERERLFDRQFGDGFTAYTLAHRAQALTQKLGRLLRTEKDSGVALVVDARLKNWNPRTWQKFATMLAPYQIERCPLATAINEAQNFLAQQGAFARS